MFVGEHMNIIEIIREAIMKKASDLHIVVGVPITLRVNGRLKYLDGNKLTPQLTLQYVKELVSESQWKTLNLKGEIDFSYSIEGLHRIRVNAFKQRNTYSMAIRLVDARIPTFSELGLPSIVKDLSALNSGLILVTGPTGSGKSTTLASIINYINETKDKNIITLEDPIEYLFRHNKSIIQQREIGMDTISFANALRATLRQDPDVILVGEMRDYETISIALTAAETGHLVLSTLHTIGASNTINRIIDAFPSHQQQQIRLQLAMTLQGVLSQQLITTVDGKGRVVAVEVMLVNSAIRNLIREGKAHQINNIIQSSGKQGMRLMDDSLCELYKQGKITLERTLEYSIDLDYIKTLLR